MMADPERQPPGIHLFLDSHCRGLLINAQSPAASGHEQSMSGCISLTLRP